MIMNSNVLHDCYYKDITCFRNDTQYIIRVVGSGGEWRLLFGITIVFINIKNSELFNIFHRNRFGGGVCDPLTFHLSFVIDASAW